MSTQMGSTDKALQRAGAINEYEKEAKKNTKSISI